ncbi:MAG TPA: tRNA uridine-5-carboxymethylaminomethyl(34) synthesis GTPase MnmE [Burkholderiaceae bacterium]|nr:tRNA uridine-5-carboxymethylaminomethyl(34) synthesis GTPase MnmE [Burkholderiaceae bacterium]
MLSDSDPIVAIATAPGRGGIGIVRVSGTNIEPIVLGVLGEQQARRLQPRRALHARFLDATGQCIDNGLALLFPAPGSYTGESVLELHGHGGMVVLRLVLARCLEAGRSLGARMAEPGEFTRRAFLNGRLDLAQAEAIADLIDAGTAAAARGALRSLQGEFSRSVQQLAADLTQLRALTEATLDFPEEEIDFLRAADASARLQRAAASLERVRERARQGVLLREGVHVALVGAPNVGKSSLLNALAGEDVAIVTEHPGTTRDRIERTIEISGIALNVIDTAGLRSTSDPIEGIGIERTLAAMAHADVVVELHDDQAHMQGGPSSAEIDDLVQARLAPGAARLIVRNKIDLSGSTPGAREGRVYLSAKTGAGIDSLRSELLRVAGWSSQIGDETVFLARDRHLQALERAASHLDEARAHAAAGAARLELFAEDLRLAADALGEITGAVSSEDILGQIFGRFCIGK